jgi:hypothetical protein
MASPALIDPLQPSLAATDMVCVKIETVAWEKEAVKERVPGTLTVRVEQVLRGTTVKRADQLQLPVWNDTVGELVIDGTSPWNLLPLKKDEQLVLFLAPKVRAYDDWASSVKGLKVINARPASATLLRDLALVERCRHLKEDDLFPVDTLNDPKVRGGEFVRFVAEWVFRHQRTTPEVRRQVLISTAFATLSPDERADLIRSATSDFVPRAAKSTPGEVQVLVNMLGTCLTEKPVRERVGKSLVSGLHEVLIKQSLIGKVKLDPIQVPRWIGAVRAVDHSHSKEVIEALTNWLKAQK